MGNACERLAERLRRLGTVDMRHVAMSSGDDPAAAATEVLAADR